MNQHSFKGDGVVMPVPERAIIRRPSGRIVILAAQSLQWRPYLRYSVMGSVLALFGVEWMGQLIDGRSTLELLFPRRCARAAPSNFVKSLNSRTKVFSRNTGQLDFFYHTQS